jgi:hypothetical protein
MSGTVVGADAANEGRPRPAVVRPTDHVGPLVALLSLARCVLAAGYLLARRRIHLPTGRRGTEVRLPDGTASRVYRETVVDRRPAAEPCALVVTFRLRAVRGRGHAVFRWESLLNTPLFVGFAGFVSKLWLTHDEHGAYRGLYDWDGAAAAEHYAGSLWWVLALVSVPGSIHHLVLPGVRRDDLLARTELIARCGGAPRPAGGR